MLVWANYSVWILKVIFYWKSTINLTFSDLGHIILANYSKIKLKWLDFKNGLYSLLDGAAAQCAVVRGKISFTTWTLWLLSHQARPKLSSSSWESDAWQSLNSRCNWRGMQWGWGKNWANSFFLPATPHLSMLVRPDFWYKSICPESKISYFLFIKAGAVVWQTRSAIQRS